MNDLIADMLARIQNAIMRNKEFVSVLNTNINRDILKVLKKEEMIKDFKLNEDSRTVDVELLYENKEPVISKLQRVSKPGQRIYVTKKEIKPIMNGRGISIISTSQGVMSGSVAKSKDLGGEFICKVW
ncbi:30S ribosomal protein S8 [Candidatus Dojkabacteria bacterium]|jgi:small subunit ribosomal protein S8|nr:30S ribosomal protein S8 [Candidatus Dojkabacteria bacterium]